MNTTPSTTPPTPFEDFQRGDRIRFATQRTAFTGQKMGVVLVWREGTVQLATDRALTIACDLPNPIGRRAILKRAEWAQRCPQKL